MPAFSLHEWKSRWMCLFVQRVFGYAVRYASGAVPKRGLRTVIFLATLLPVCLLEGSGVEGNFRATATSIADGGLIVESLSDNSHRVGVFIESGTLTSVFPSSDPVAAPVAPNPKKGLRLAKPTPAPSLPVERWSLKLPSGESSQDFKVRILRKGDNWITQFSEDGNAWSRHMAQRLPGMDGPVRIKVDGSFSDLVMEGEQVREFFHISTQDAVWKSPSTIAELSGIVQGLSQAALPQGRFQPRSGMNPLGYEDGVPPWQPLYKKPEPLIPALDLPGPDGLVYPNFTYAGVQGGIPVNLPVRVNIAPGGSDFASELEAAVAATAGQGGGVIQLQSGTYRLNRPVGITNNNIVLRGRGPAETFIECTFFLRPQSLSWLSPAADGAELGPGDLLEAFADLDTPADGIDNAGELRLFVDDREVAVTKWHSTEPSQFRATTSLRNIGIASGEHIVRAEVRWKDGSTHRESRTFTYNPVLSSKPDAIGAGAFITFAGLHAPESVPLGESLPRGAMGMKAPAELDFRPGDFLGIKIGPDRDWMQTVKAVFMADGKSWLGRAALLQVRSVENGELRFNQPLRLAMEAAPSARVMKVPMITGCGVEDLAITCPEKNWLHSVMFRQAANCWIKNVHFLKIGRNPFETSWAKWIEVRDIEAHDAWFKQGGGTAYISFSNAHDSLLDGVKSSRLRHAPNLSWFSSGCVLRNGDYVDSDAQIHCGWPTENLFENNTVISRREHGSYGYGFYAQGPEADIHGPQGPRNVLYNNDFTSDEAGVWLGGSNEAYLILHNRFLVKKGPAVFLKQGAFDNTFLGNVFITPQAGLAAVLQATPDCVGNDYINNVFGGLVGSIEHPLHVFAGSAPPAVNVGNRVTRETDLPRPQPPVPSLYDWQIANCKSQPEPENNPEPENKPPL